jgi:hypothetical protein
MRALNQKRSSDRFLSHPKVRCFPQLSSHQEFARKIARLGSVLNTTVKSTDFGLFFFSTISVFSCLPFASNRLLSARDLCQNTAPICVPCRQCHTADKQQNKQTPWSLVRKRTIPTERQPLVTKFSANFCA